MDTKKRKPTKYAILVKPGGKDDIKYLPCGVVEAFTPEQARRRAANDLPLVAIAAGADGGAVMLYAVPITSMTGTLVEVERVTRVKVGATDA